MTMPRVFVGLVLLAMAGPAAAQPPPIEPLRTRWPVDTTVVVGSLAVAALASRIAVDEGSRWSRELLPIDEGVKQNYSPPAARASDVLLGATVLGPLLVQGAGGIDRAAGERALVYGETLATNLALNGITKVLVGRPRPYAYSADPRAQAQVEHDRRDARLSFYSGHASTAFAAAVGGAFLFSQSNDDPVARTAVWAGSLMLAGATSNLRVRAGKHFYSDVLTGAVVGAGVGVLVPALHLGGAPRALAPAEWIAIGTAPLAGALLGQLVPLGAGDRPDRPILAGARLVPWVTGQGAGAMVAGLF
jgi:membrane-associated phospholipid phosphatase